MMAQTTLIQEPGGNVHKVYGRHENRKGTQEDKGIVFAICSSLSFLATKN